MSETERLVSHAVANMRLSAIKDMAMRSARVEDAASLTWGLPSFRTPEHIRAAVKQALDDDLDAGKYALPDGLPALRRLVAERHREATGVAVDPDRNVMVTAGNMQGLSTLFHVLLDPGDEVILTDPCFASHIQQIVMCSGVPVYWPMDEARDWALDVTALKALITPRTKAIVLVTPSNPTGKIFSEAELRAVGEIARQAGIMILLDDPYSAFAYEHRARLFNPACVQELADNLVYLFTFSKCHAMSGWRLGYMIVPEELKRHIVKVHDATMLCTPRISQIAGIAALGGPQEHLRQFEDTLALRRDLICQRLDAVPHVFDYVRPEGAYYVFPRIVAQHQDSFTFAIDLLEQARVTVTPGSAFGPGGEHHVRMAYCVDEATINLAFDRIEAHFPA